MMALVLENAHWFWLSLGGLLLAAEMLGAAGYLLWSGVAALLTGILAWLLPLDWAWQSTAFAVLTVIAALSWWQWLRRRLEKQPSPVLNQRGQQLIGLHTTLSEPLVNGFGRINIGDSSWRIQAEQDLPAGTVVEVTAVEGITLQVKPRK
ncbi:NfeD family protein [Dickeya zeae]|jgi:membrane protein implicated in regulation of membrane protease activity|uniref:NfeD family protein n=1 Tax=Dickeya zeae TaxID=204042 RepID=UPI000364496F|nr:NfeD family protein [Dickeya zeae]MCA6985979.1 NfeD family protein [Dickeya zeae]UJR53587.1 NfeD family protein [Dickeya zeae MS1]UJR62710.1 NfeD family protein [Dickeya zeae]UPT56895.1 NfeD family protein [Dickeya zeae]